MDTNDFEDVWNMRYPLMKTASWVQMGHKREDVCAEEAVELKRQDYCYDLCC